MYSCPSCKALINVRGNESYILVCRSCRTVVANEKNEIIALYPMPDDWSIVQLGTTGVYKLNPFVVIGRVRLRHGEDGVRGRSIRLSEIVRQRLVFPYLADVRAGRMELQIESPVADEIW